MNCMYGKSLFFDTELAMVGHGLGYDGSGGFMYKIEGVSGKIIIVYGRVKIAYLCSSLRIFEICPKQQASNRK